MPTQHEASTCDTEYLSELGDGTEKKWLNFLKVYENTWSGPGGLSPLESSLERPLERDTSLSPAWSIHTKSISWWDVGAGTFQHAGPASQYNPWDPGTSVIDLPVLVFAGKALEY